MISAILSPLTRAYSRVVAIGNAGEMTATRLPGEKVATLIPSYHHSYEIGGYVRHLSNGTVKPVDLESKFEMWASEHQTYADECNLAIPYDSSPDDCFSRDQAWREMQSIAAALLPDDALEALSASHGADPAMVRAALDGDATARWELYQQSRPEE